MDGWRQSQGHRAGGRMSLNRLVWAALLSSAVVAGCGQTGEPPATVTSTGQTSADQASSSTKVSARATHPAVQEPLRMAERGESEEALELLNQLVQREPELAAAYDARGTVLHQLGRFPEALRDLDQAITLQGKDPRLFNNRGFLKLSLQQFSAAIADFQTALQLAPHYANAYNNLGLVEIAQGQFRQAVEYLEQALRHDANYVDAYNNRGFAQLQLGRFDLALADFNRALQLNPNYVNALHNRGLLKHQQGDLEGAVIDFTLGMVIDPGNAKLYEHRRESYLAQGNARQAQADQSKIEYLLQLQNLTTAILREPTAEAYFARAEHLSQQGDSTAALRDYERALAMDDQHGAARLGRARIRLSDGQADAALEDCQAVLQQQPTNVEALSLRGDCYFQRREWSLAINDFAAARRLDETVADAYHSWGEQIVRDGGSPSEAEQYFQRAEKLRAFMREPISSEVRQAAAMPEEPADQADGPVVPTSSESGESSAATPAAASETAPEAAPESTP
jgi:tetratricopeptide (TPR) repeat protein